MPVVTTYSPKSLTSQNVNVLAADADAWRPDYTFNCDSAHQNPRVHLFLELSWSLPSLEVQSPSDVCGPVKILGSRVKQVDFIIV